MALLVATVLITLSAMPMALLATTRPEPGGVALVIVPPWAPGGASGVVAAAGGREIGPMRAPFAVLAVFNGHDMGMSHGAWAILDGRLIAAICGVEPSDIGGEAGRV